MSRWVVEIWTPCEVMDSEEFDNALDALVFAKERTKGGYSGATIRPSTREYEVREFEEALNKGEIE